MEADMAGPVPPCAKLSFTYFDNTKTGHIMSRISNDLNLISEVAHHAPEDLLISVVVIIGAYAFMFMFSLRLRSSRSFRFPSWCSGAFSSADACGRDSGGCREVADINSTVENP